MLNVRILTEQETQRWDDAVQASPQGSIFTSTLWLRGTGLPYRVLGCFRGGELVGGFAFCYQTRWPAAVVLPQITPYQGLLTFPPPGASETDAVILQQYVAEAVAVYLGQEDFGRIIIGNHPSFADVRPLQWAGYNVYLRYTYWMPLGTEESMLARCESSARYEIRKARKVGLTVKVGEVEAFDSLHYLTFARQKKPCPVPTGRLMHWYRHLRLAGAGEIYTVYTPEGEALAGAFMAWDTRRAYYLMGASDPVHRNTGGGSLCLWEALRAAAGHAAEADLCGANLPSIAKFKRSFGPELRHYFIAERTSTAFRAYKAAGRALAWLRRS